MNTTTVHVYRMSEDTLSALAPYARKARREAGGTDEHSDAATMRYAAEELLRRLREDETAGGESNAGS